MLQHGAYNLLMDAIYDREQFPTRDEAIDWLWAETDEEIAAVDFVLRKFFKLDGEKYVQKRIVEEIEKYHGFCKSQAERGKRGGRPKKPEKTQRVSDGIPAETQSNPEQSLTTNQLTTNQLTKVTPHSDKPKRKTKTQMPENFNLDLVRASKARRYWKDKGREDLVSRGADIWEQFINHHRKLGSRFACWDSAWQTWYVNAIKFEKPVPKSETGFLQRVTSDNWAEGLN